MKHLPLLACFVLTGCGHMFFPAVQRLSPEEQATVDQMWNNMLSPPDRLNRELLLDVVEAYQLHVTGIDRLKMECDKDFAEGTVHMSVDFNRRRPPEDDRFVIQIRDRQGKLLRRETYSGEEVLSHGQQIMGSVVQAQIKLSIGPEATTQATTHPCTAESPGTDATSPSVPLTEAEKADEAWRDARWRQIQAATQPVETPAPTIKP